MAGRVMTVPEKRSKVQPKEHSLLCDLDGRESRVEDAWEEQKRES
jgi:hypothetical protein